MRKIILACLLVLLILTITNPAQAKLNEGQFILSADKGRITVQAENASVRKILAALEEKTGLKMVVYEGVPDRKVTLNTEAIPIAAIDTLLKQLSLRNTAIVYEEKLRSMTLYVLPEGMNPSTVLPGKTIIRPATFSDPSKTNEIKGKPIITTLQGKNKVPIRYVDGEILLKFHRGVTKEEIDALLSKYRLEKNGATDLSQLGYVKVLIGDGRSVLDVVKEIRKENKLKIPEPNYILSTLAVTDPLYNQQWYAPETYADKAWDMLKRRDMVRVAIIDTGVNGNHPDLKGRVLKGYDFVNGKDDTGDDHGHGTFAAGIIAASANEIGIRGLYDFAQILPVRVVGKDGIGTYEDTAKGIIWAADQGAKVINLSIGGYGYSYILQDAVDYALEKGCLLVAAGGNDGTKQPIYPAAYPDVIGVSALSHDGHIWSSSNNGKHIDVAAPGTDILSTGLGEDYVYVTGTSAAASVVSALAAMIVSERPDLSSSAIERIIMQSAKDLGQEGRDDIYGNGEINFLNALQQKIQPFHDAAVGKIYPDRKNNDRKEFYIDIVLRNLGTYPEELASVTITMKDIVSKKNVRIHRKGLIHIPYTLPDSTSDSIDIRVEIEVKDDENKENNTRSARLIPSYDSKQNLWILYSQNAHQWIAEQAMYEWPGTNTGNLPAFKEFSDYLESIKVGAYNEDVFNITNIPGAPNPYNPFGHYMPFLRHFWDHRNYEDPSPTEGALSGSGLVEGKTDTAVNRAYKYWFGGYGADLVYDEEWEGGYGVKEKGATQLYYDGKKSSAYIYLGHIAHLLADMAVPAHVLNDPHGGWFAGGDDAYEDFMSNPTNFQHHGDNGGVHQVTASVPSYPSNLTYLFNKMAKIAADFESDNYSGKVYSTTGSDVLPAECANHRDTLEPQAILHVAALYKMFWKQAHPDDAYENNNTFATAKGIPTSFSDPNLISYDDDWYQVYANAGSDLNITINFTHSNGNLDLGLYNASGTLVKYSYSSLNQETISYSVPSTGYYFIKVFGNNGAANPSYSMTVNVTPTIYTVSYDINEGTGQAPDSQTKMYNKDLQLEGEGNLTRTGYRFAGWNTAANGSGTDYAAGGTYSNNASVTLYAKWIDTPNPIISGRVTRSNTGMDGVTINFSDNAGTDTTSGGGYYSKQVTNGWSGSVTPSYSSGSFSPPSQSYGNVTSNQGDQNYTWTPDDVVSSPSFNPDGGPYPGDSVIVTVSCATASATIRYTTNGTEPTESSLTVLSGGTVTVPLPGTLKAKAWKIGMTTSATKTAVYIISEGNNYTLTVKKTGNGTVTSSPPGVSCGGDCSENYTGGTSVTLTATPDVGFTFAGWSGACSGKGTCTVTLDTAKTVIAAFNDRAWRRQRYDIGGTNYYPYGSNQNNGQLALKWSKSMNNPAVLTADINNDGFLEVVCSNGSQLMAYDKVGTLLWSVNTTAGLSYIGDANGDDLLEIFVTYRDGSNNLKSDVYTGTGTFIKTLNVGQYASGSSWRIVHNRGDKLIGLGASAGGIPNSRGVFTVSYSTGQKLSFYGQGPVPYSMAIGDINNDGLLEIATMAGTWHNGVSANGTTDSDIYGIVSNENGVNIFTKLITTWNTSAKRDGVLAWMFTDLDNDGTPEMVAMEGHDPTYYPGTGYVYLINSLGQKIAQWAGPQNPGHGYFYSSADINGNGDKEIIISTGSDGTIYILDKNLNLLSQSSAGQGLVIGITDFDGDGQLELLVNKKGTGIIKVLKKDLSTVMSTYDVGGSGYVWHDHQFAISDIDNDGINDIIISTSSGLHVLSPLAQGAPHLLTVSKSGMGGGTITSNPPGITCGADCSEFYPSSSTITLTAVPNSISTFTGWSGDCSGMETCTLSMIGNRNITATFNLLSSQKRVAVINPDSYRILKMGELYGDGNFYSIASATVADDHKDYGSNPANWTGVGVHSDFISSILTKAGYQVDQYEAGSLPSISSNDYQVVIIQDPLRSNMQIFQKTTENNLPDLLEYVKDEAFLNKIKAYFNSGGNIIFVGDAVRLMEDGPGRLNWGKSILTKSVLNNKSVADSRLSDHWLFIKGGPFCGKDRTGSGQYRVNSSPLFTSGTMLSSLTFFNGNDLPHQMTWSDTFYYPGDGTSLLTVDITGSGQYVLISNVCSPPVYTVQVNETVPHLIGYTTYNGRKLHYIGSDSLFDFYYKNNEGAWHASQYRSMDYTLTNDGADIISKLVDQALLRGDLDGNLTTDLADAILGLQLLSGVTPISNVYTHADVNGDGMIGLPEVIYILQKVSGVR